MKVICFSIRFYLFVVVLIISIDVQAQPGTKNWTENITIRLHKELNTTYYGHDEIFYCDTIDSLLEPGLNITGHYLNSYPYVLDRLRVRGFSNIKFQKGDDVINILVKCRFELRKKRYSSTQLYFMDNLPHEGNYFIELDSLVENSKRVLFLTTEMLDITPENWSELRISEEEYLSRIKASRRKMKS